MRPTGEIRRALREAAHALTTQRGHAVTWRDLAAHACVGQQIARRTVVNMARAGELQAAGALHVPGGRRPMTAYVPACTPAPDPDPPLPLDQLLRAWAN